MGAAERFVPWEVARDLERVERQLMEATVDVAACRKWATGQTPLLPARAQRAALRDLGEAVAQARRDLARVERVIRVALEDA